MLTITSCLAAEIILKYRDVFTSILAMIKKFRVAVHPPCFYLRLQVVEICFSAHLPIAQAAITWFKDND